MRLLNIMVAGAAVASAAGIAAAAHRPGPHIATFRLPGGVIEQIAYVGAPPTVVATCPQAAERAALADPFIRFERLQAQMDRMMRAQFQALNPGAPLAMAPGVFGQLRPVGIARLPAGAERWSSVTTVRGGRACSRTTEIISRGPGQPPKVMTRVSGDCAAAQARPGPALAAPAAAPPPNRTV